MTKREADKKILQYTKKIYGFALSKTSDYEQAQELAQEIICEVYISLLNSGYVANCDGYVYRIASNVFSKFVGGLIEGRKMTCIDDHPVAVNDKYFYEDSKDQLEALKKEIGYLSQRQRSVVYLFYYEKKSVKEIADELKISANTVKWHLSDARQTLKETIIMSENVKIDENQAVNPIKFEFLASSGTIVSKGTEDFFDTRLKQNIAWACYKEPKTVAEIARAVGVSAAYIVDEMKVLVDNGFINQVDNSKNPKYQSVIVLSDLRSVELGADGFYKDDGAEQNREIARKLCQEYYKPIFDAFEKDSEHWGMSCPENDENFMKYSLVLLAQKFLQADNNMDVEMEKLKIKRPDGGNYIANAVVVNDWQEIKAEKFPNWIGGYMINWGEDYHSVQANCRYIDRGADWREQCCFEALAKFVHSDCNPKSIKLEDYEKICKIGYVHNDSVQVVLMRGGKKSPWNLLESYMKPFANVIESLKEFGKQMDKAGKEMMLKNDEPEYAKRFHQAMFLDRIGNQELIPYIIEEMLKNGMLESLSTVQKKAAMSVLSV